jgi:hypothetical protein
MNLSSKKLYGSTVTVDFVKPLSYQFRVAEILGDDGQIATVKLQTTVWEHDENGYGTVKQGWTDVPRIRFDKHGGLIEPL